ncbi:hypothetical protein [Pyxidicoccus trucidator]|uniref:hypothetical protein n=1 Tax=Pyxidicoccus trucidator TaxID=2709662 RepID=UPI0019680B69|nr:hypothetical protein [Pyxidicoccus trucidator]
MALPPDEYARAAVDAALHVQVEIERVELPPGKSGEAVVVGRVARVFRGAPELLSSRISFEVSCLREDDHDLPPGGTLWTRGEDLEQAKVLETYLDRDDQGRFHVPLWQSFIIDEVTDTPLFLVTEEEARRLEDEFGPPRTRARRLRYAMALVLHHGLVLLLGLGGLAAIGYFAWTLVEWQRAP